jgi:hypothetical protein
MKFSPAKVPAYIAGRDCWIDDAVADSRALFREQRYHGFETMNDTIVVGGVCTLWRVGSDGIAARDILDFGDEIGRRADISDSGRDLLNMREIEIA